MGERYYDPRTARWTQKDPLDQSADLREGNGHAYAGADPVNRSDMSGLDIQFSGSFYYIPGGSFSLTLEDEGFPVHLSVGAGVGAGGGTSLQFGEFNPYPHVGVYGDVCGGIRCGNAFAGLRGTGYGYEWTAEYEEHSGIGLGGGAGVRVGF